ncbi:hypothetical protein AB5J52_48570 (plasmid) [Streptomyces sp. R39]|uniref:HD domain-containing protein n=1 Tax=Streptomyces sp. R39 TaxID=3238631 RepID=A0AB39RAH6_9ACTN
MAGFLARTRQDPRAATAFRLAAAWGPGQTVAGRDALGHAVTVASILGCYIPDAPPQVVAACLLHGIPRWPMADEDVYRFVEAQCGVEARLLLAALRDEQAVLAVPSDRAVEGHLRLLRAMPWLVHVTLAVKIVVLQYAIGRPARGRDTDAGCAPFTSSQVPYLRGLHDLAAEFGLQTMSADYLRLLKQCLPVTTAAASR